MNDVQRREIKSHLVDGLSALMDQESVEGFSTENCPDDTDFASQLTEQGVKMAMQRRRSARIAELESALRRLGETDYGLCEECDEEIGVARLKANPSARLCVVCQSAVEDGLKRCA